MIHFCNRDDVIKFAMGHLPKQYRSIARSFEEGKVEFLGGFKDTFFSGWKIKITSKFRKICYLFVYIHHLNQPQLQIMDEIDWQKWNGEKSDNPLYQGDFPDKYRRLKENAIKEHRLDKNNRCT